MMEDLIARLYPHGESEDGYASHTIKRSENSSRYVDAENISPELRGRDSRESTAPPDDSKDVDGARLYRGRGLQLTFTVGPKASPGFVFGTDANRCDIVLPPLKGISRHHCYLTFDVDQRLILRDISSYGTAVEYNGRGGEKRRHFTWVLGGDRLPAKSDSIVIKLHRSLSFRIVVAKPTYYEIYSENVDQFLEDTALTDSVSLGALGIQSVASTTVPSGAGTPKQDPILLEQEMLGSGTFAVVKRVWDVSTGREYACKKFIDLKRSDWRKEASLMRSSLHVSFKTDMEKKSY